MFIQTDRFCNYQRQARKVTVVEAALSSVRCVKWQLSCCQRNCPANSYRRSSLLGDSAVSICPPEPPYSYSPEMCSSQALMSQAKRAEAPSPGRKHFPLSLTAGKEGCKVRGRYAPVMGFRMLFLIRLEVIEDRRSPASFGVARGCSGAGQ
ncbi:hypothetical protein N657DRAFT_250584 [Parathielavia appendiculata]|uniref:Uncharacterized protein n=1 Tax=Parathielavia appendiculata TaxID=2587402 RepID=A0AAN6TS10_9PEZI|nr:hypothetical protein N657DRAFT_250584 [Parathielavia appendiculata]